MQQFLAEHDNRFQLILDRITIRTILEDAGIRADRNRISCPVHGGDNPSSFSFTDSTFHCFACGASGGLIDLVAHLRGTGRADAIRYLSALAGLSSLPCGHRNHHVSPARHRSPPDFDPVAAAIVERYEWLKLYRDALDCCLRIHKRCMREGTISLPDFYAKEQLCLYQLEETDGLFIVTVHDFHKITKKGK